nr:MAG TPA: hypothetical protein [Caudoviricetes sp.]
MLNSYFPLERTWCVSYFLPSFKYLTSFFKSLSKDSFAFVSIEWRLV